MRHLAFIIYFFLLSLGLSAQNNDSLKQVWQNSSLSDTTRLKAYIQLIGASYLFPKPDSAYLMAGEALEFARKANQRKYEAMALNTQGSARYVTGVYKEAINLYMASLKIREELGDRKGMAGPLNNIGNIYSDQSDYARAMDFYTKSLRIEEEVGNKKGIASSLNNIGTICQEQGDNKKAIDYYSRSLKIKEEIGDKRGMAYTLNNIGNIYLKEKDNVKAMEYQLRSLKIREELGNASDIALSLLAVGTVHKAQGQPQSAITYYEAALKLQESINDNKGIANSLGDMGSAYKEMGDYKKAIEYSKRALKLNEETGVLIRTREVAELLYECYKKTGDFKSALEMHRLFINARDTILSEENQKEVLKQEMEYNFEKEKAVAEKEHEKEILVAQEQATRQQIVSYAIGFGLLLLVVFSVYIVSRLRLTRKQKDIIAHQKLIVEEKQKEIIDSISYAKRLQEAILPPEHFLKTHLPESFILYKPKDIVAGDFYWMEVLKDGIILLAAADCTGHGVPGAMVSVVCSNALNRVVLEFGYTDPGMILDKTRELVLATFSKSDKDVKDGMDISLLMIDRKMNQVKWAGANNPLWYITNDQFCEVTANKQPIGMTDNPKPFTTHTFVLNEIDAVYLFTDGYADQFGGAKGKKFKYKPLKEILFNNASQPMHTQDQILEEAFDKWKGKLEQVDDVCILGIKLSKNF
ncbi:MAG: protein serine/threonine phosphatase [Bacteroidota bacterium]|jgi:tetratricopeptide (TPR) repeat protein/serine phosphatase RsbU (regulator of sigma subunit)|nr:protein serine/threonine phosphatase [Bacteroidota bacterium]